MGSKKKLPYDAEFREGAVRIVVETGRSAGEVAEELGKNPGTLHSWVSRGRRNGTTSSERLVQPTAASGGGGGGRVREAERLDADDVHGPLVPLGQSRSRDLDDRLGHVAPPAAGLHHRDPEPSIDAARDEVGGPGGRTAASKAVCPRYLLEFTTPRLPLPPSRSARVNPERCD